MSDYEVKPVNTKGNEKRKTIPKPFRRQKQSVEDRDREDGCDYVPESTKLLNDNLGNNTQDKDDRFIDNMDNVHSKDTQNQNDIRNHLPSKNAEACEDHACATVMNNDFSSSGNGKRRRIAFSTSNGISTGSQDNSEEDSQEAGCHKEQYGNESFKEQCSRHVL